MFLDPLGVHDRAVLPVGGVGGIASMSNWSSYLAAGSSSMAISPFEAPSRSATSAASSNAASCMVRANAFQTSCVACRTMADPSSSASSLPSSSGSSTPPKQQRLFWRLKHLHQTQNDTAAYARSAKTSPSMIFVSIGYPSSSCAIGRVGSGTVSSSSSSVPLSITWLRDVVAIVGLVLVLVVVTAAADTLMEKPSSGCKA
mmetsp:Transcript_52384/g.122635  ORF Transcript_52384/g.122635 Transcript_52384/m.122635 type:complete len:201 (+) Transcript_52384:2218-2820(+)